MGAKMSPLLLIGPAISRPGASQHEPQNEWIPPVSALENVSIKDDSLLYKDTGTEDSSILLPDTSLLLPWSEEDERAEKGQEFQELSSPHVETSYQNTWFGKTENFIQRL